MNSIAYFLLSLSIAPANATVSVDTILHEQEHIKIEDVTYQGKPFLASSEVSICGLIGYKRFVRATHELHLAAGDMDHKPINRILVVPGNTYSVRTQDVNVPSTNDVYKVKTITCAK